MILTNTTGFESRNYYFSPKCQRHKHLPVPLMPEPEHVDGSEGNPGFLACSSVWGLWPASPWHLLKIYSVTPFPALCLLVWPAHTLGLGTRKGPCLPCCHPVRVPGQPLKKQAISMWFAKGFGISFLLSPWEKSKYFKRHRAITDIFLCWDFLKPFQVRSFQKRP